MCVRVWESVYVYVCAYVCVCVVVRVHLKKNKNHSHTFINVGCSNQMSNVICRMTCSYEHIVSHTCDITHTTSDIYI